MHLLMNFSSAAKDISTEIDSTEIPLKSVLIKAADPLFSDGAAFAPELT